MSERPSVEELRTAADVLERQALVLRKRSPLLHVEHPQSTSFCAAELFIEALRLDTERAATKAEEELIEAIARVIYDSSTAWEESWLASESTTRNSYRDNARALLAEFVITRREDK